ncbi:MAG TPA: M20 family peptidase [bacterium]|nr:M20 family peptidase [bacterium]
MKLPSILTLASTALVFSASAGCLGHRVPRASHPPAPITQVDAQGAAAHLAEAIRFQTVSHQDPAQDDHTQFVALRAFLEKTYPHAHAAMTRELVNGDGLLFTWKGTDESKAPVVFMAHQDVVPVEPGTEGKWTHAPFGGEIADGFVWGRGAMDDKGSLIALFEAIDVLAAQGIHPVRTLYVVSGFDEEVGGREGSKRIAELLQSRGVKPEFVLDEGGLVTEGLVPGVARQVAFVSVSEKGYVSVQLVAHGDGGHSSMPPAQTAIGILAVAIDRLQKNQMPSHLIPVQREAFAVLAPEMPFSRRLIFSNLWLFHGVAANALAARKESAPTVRTTTAPTILQAGVKENVLPSTASGVVNFRILPGESIATVLAHVRTVIDDKRVDVTALDRTISEPAPLSSTTSRGYKLLAKTVADFYPDALVVPGVVNGATDSRHFNGMATDVYRFIPRVAARDDIPRLHGTDERLGVENLARSIAGYEQIIREAVEH